MESKYISFIIFLVTSLRRKRVVVRVPVSHVFLRLCNIVCDFSTI